MIGTEIEVDLLIKNARIVNVFTNEIIAGDLAIKDGKIVGIGSYKSKEYIDASNKFVAPSFIDSHVHIESAMVSPSQFAKSVIKRGTTTLIADPHEIANVCGLDGIRYILDATEEIPTDVYVMLPSCVPATEFETSGAILKAKDLKQLIDNERVLGLGELMDFVGVINRRADILDKIEIAKGKIIDGHGPMIAGKDLDAYVSAGVKTDHECSTVKEMIDRLRRGLYVQIREGSAAKNLAELVKGVTKDNLRRCLFCTDDRHPEDLIENGHIDNNVRLSIEKGVDPIDAIKMASLNAAECYGLKNVGAIAPGYMADLVIFQDLNDIRVETVFKAGKCVADHGKVIVDFPEYADGRVMSKMNIRDIVSEDIQIKLSKSKVNVIGVLKDQLITDLRQREVSLVDGKFEYGDDGISKVVLIERHTGKSSVMAALVEGYGIRCGAIGTTIAHDSHNLIVIGDNDKDILKCISKIKEMEGGIAISSSGKILSSLKLDIAGLMTTEDIEFVKERMEDMLNVARGLGVAEGVDPFMTLSFLALPVIPNVKITDKGLFDVINFKFIDIESDN